MLLCSSNAALLPAADRLPRSAPLVVRRGALVVPPVVVVLLVVVVPVLVQVVLGLVWYSVLTLSSVRM